MAGIHSRRIVTPRIVQPGSGARPWVILAGLVALLGWTWLAYDLGREQAGFHSRKAAQQRADARAEIRALREERDALRLRAASNERASQIDRDAARQVQDQAKALQEERADLKREVAFLRELISSGDGIFQVRDFRVEPLDGETQFRYRFTVAQARADLGRVSGEIGVAVTGVADGKARRLSLKDLTGGKLSVHKMGFRNFQDVEGTFELPEDFVPQAVVLDIRPEGKDLKPLQRVFDWKKTGA